VHFGPEGIIEERTGSSVTAEHPSPLMCVSLLTVGNCMILNCH